MMARSPVPLPLLSEVLAGLAELPRGRDRALADLTLDSREVTLGSCFVALAGSRADGARYIDDAVRRGACAILCERPQRVPRHAALVVVPDLRRHLGLIASRFFDSPAAALEVCAVTGTNGKTSVAHLYAQAATLLGRGCGYIGTLGAGTPGALTPTANTTPDVITSNRWLARFRADGLSAAALEASSHALAQERLAGLALSAAAFTNLGHDHLDYHADLAAYARAKRRLFEQPGLRQAIVNIDDATGRDIAATLASGVEVWRVSSGGAGTEPPADARVVATAITAHAAGMRFTLAAEGRSAVIESRLGGRFNVDNLLTVAALLLAGGHAFGPVAGVLGGLALVPGRMQACGVTPAGANVVVDYAHSPDSLAALLVAARALAPARIWLVFGCGGERDRSKRPLMGAVAESGADEVIVTSDNPRSEAPEMIAREIMAGMRGQAARYVEDRALAIRTALAAAATGDLVLVAGKGHEATQECAGVLRPFSDAEVIAGLLDGVRR